MSIVAEQPQTESSGSDFLTSTESTNSGMGDALGMGLMSLEGTAVQFGVLPVELPREACSIAAETLLRKLGRFPQTDNPWLPVSNIGPFVIFAHHHPKSDDMWGVPSCFGIRIAISERQYEAIRKDLVQRLSVNPLAKGNPLEGLEAPRFEPNDFDAAFEWLLSAYPFDEKVVERLGMLHAESIEKNGFMDMDSFNKMEPGLGVALKYLLEGPSFLCFNGEEAPRQEIFSAPILEKHNVYPVYDGGQKIYLLTAEDNFYAFEDEWLSQGNDPVEFVPVIADPTSIKGAISRCATRLQTAGIEIEKGSLSLSEAENLVEIEPEDVAEINPLNVNHTPEELMHWVLYSSVSGRASDLHLEKYYNVVRFRARIDGKLTTIFTAPEDLMPRFIALIKNYSNMSQSRQEALDGRFAMKLGSRRVDVRVAAVPCRNEFQKVIMRFLDKQDGVKELSTLNMSKRQSMIVKRVMGRDQGLVLITGPTGSGKTTTLYALINSVNEEGINIHTIEDPIEYEIEGINQTQTDPTHELTFANGLRALLRSDPDVILIGECRDQETATSAINAALTGHLVLTTLHANDSLRAVSRLLSMGVEPHLVGDSLAMTQAQRLVRKLCNYCKKVTPLSPEIVDHFYRQGFKVNPDTSPIYKAVGCPECRNTGYNGRLALMEMCEVSAELADLIERQAPQTELRKVALKTGFMTLYQEGITQVLAGLTTLDEIKKVSYTAF
ncbi:MAG: GspE/PulE family protein [Verrucomicrobiales bacterium]|nr:GspE/PulE family protein [Verrucomicrobiales bacterium]